MSRIKNVSAASMQLKSHLQRQAKGAHSCYEFLDQQLDGMAFVLSQIKDAETVHKFFDLLYVSVPLAVASADVVASWSKVEGIYLLTKLVKWRKESEIEPILFDSQVVPIVKLLSLAANAHPNSATDVFKIWTRLIELQLHDPDDPEQHKVLEMIITWRQKMICAGFSQHVIDSWCTNLLHREELNSTVGAFTNLTPECIELLSCDYVKKCLFSTPAPEPWKSAKDPTQKVDDIALNKNCMTLARFLNEFSSATSHVTMIHPRSITVLQDGVKTLCTHFIEGSKGSAFYKVFNNVNKELFSLIFCQQTKVLQINEDKAGALTGLLTLNRRLLRSIKSRPVLFSRAKDLVQECLDCYNNKDGWQQGLHTHMIKLEQNQETINRLQSSGYNQCEDDSDTGKHDLWNSQFFELSTCLTEITRNDRLKRLHRSLWLEWKDLLLQAGVDKVKEGDTEMDTSEMFRYSDTLDHMERQANTVKYAMKKLLCNSWLDGKRRQLLSKEKIARSKLEKPEKQQRTEATGKTKPTKFVIVWENRFLEAVQISCERIPDCYAPNGHHSEKPVICGLSVDNKILALYKETNHRREELENVEVRLYSEGMLVFDIHGNHHQYMTDQFWAAFFKMMLDKRLVPKIFLYNTSPGFDWISMFVKPDSEPYISNGFGVTNKFIPASEDYNPYLYNPAFVSQLLPAADPAMKELIVLTRSNVNDFTFPDLRVDNSDQIPEQVQRVKAHLQADVRLLEMHGENRDKVLTRLHFAIQSAVKLTLEGVAPTEDSIKDLLDMKKLSHQCLEVLTHGRRAYVDLVREAVKKICGGIQSSIGSYIPTECVVFSPWPTE